MPERAYGDPCGVARALDVIGERWALLVVRELWLGPKRFTDLVRGLHGISQNVLTQRLQDLERAGVVRRRRLGPPARAAAYELTSQGQDLEPVLVALAGWGRQRPLPEGGELSEDALLLALRTSVRPGVRTRTVAELHLGEDVVRAALADGALSVRRGEAPEADLVLTADAATVRDLAFAGETVAAAVREGRLQVTRGTPGQAQRFFAAFGR